MSSDLTVNDITTADPNGITIFDLQRTKEMYIEYASTWVNSNMHADQTLDNKKKQLAKHRVTCKKNRKKRKRRKK